MYYVDWAMRRNKETGEKKWRQALNADVKGTV